MKKITVAAVAAFCVSAVHAQSSITMYGRLDTGIEYFTGIPSTTGGSKSRWSVESNDWGVSYWGLMGSEDLGGGTQATFHLDTVFNVANGNTVEPGAMWTRFATVGFTNLKYGSFYFGKSPFISNEVWEYDPLQQTIWSSGSLVRARSLPVSINNIGYRSSKIGGFEFYGQYSLSNATNWNGNGTTAQGRQAGVALSYSSALFQVKGIYDEIRDPANGKFDDVFAHSREYSIATNVFLGPVKLSAAYQTSSAPEAVPGAPTFTQHGWAGATWHITPAAALIAVAYHINANQGAGNATIYTVGGSYSLSKRTLLDFQAATVRNSSTGRFSLEPLPANDPGNPLPGHSQSGVYAGIQHQF
ncbi:putative porin [Paraburkholderia sp. UCT70]|uniref:porin n=1 Tax=Paraburkholderia sp. UCT70 TaxID=2991068 RepID=UPI003D1EFD24